MNYKEQYKNALDEYKNQLEIMRQQTRKAFEQFFVPAVQEMMVGNFTAVHWEQYTPYFNDGDECVFGINMYNAFKVGEDVKTKWDEEYFDEYDLDSEHPHLTQAAKDISEFVQSSEEFLKMVYGDHVEITITADGLEVEEYTGHD